MTYFNNIQTTFQDNGSLDAFGRLRVSNPITLFDSKQINDNRADFWDEVVGGGASSGVYASGDSTTTMSAASNGEYNIRQTKMRMNYQPGKSQQILTTFNLGSGVANVNKKIGYFNSATTGNYDTELDGIYLEQDGTTQYIVQSKNGTPDQVAQTAWNIDKFDGTGPSQITMDWGKTQIMIADFEWLGVGRVRTGFVTDGKIYYAHEFNNANSKEKTYMRSPNHSVRYEIRSTGGSSSLDQICSSVSTEGGEQALGTLHYISTAGAGLQTVAENTLYAVVGIRLKDTRLDTTVRLLNMSITTHTSSAFGEWQIIFNPTVAGTFAYSGLDNSAIDYALGAATNTVTDGVVLGGGFFEAGAAGGKGGAGGSASAGIENALRLGSTIDGTPDELVLCVRPVGGSTAMDVEGALFWRELV